MWNAVSRMALFALAFGVVPFAISNAEPNAYGTTWYAEAKEVYWGDTHVHTSLSLDAFSMGTRLRPEEEYRFARGDTVMLEDGSSATLPRVLEFVVVADHDFNLGVFKAVSSSSIDDTWPNSGNELIDQYSELQRLQDVDPERVRELLFEMTYELVRNEPVLTARAQDHIWQEVGALADAYNGSGSFTAFIGYEWTSTSRGRNAHLHRVVVYEDGSAVAGQTVPFVAAYDSDDPEELWNYFEEYEKSTGGVCSPFLTTEILAGVRCLIHGHLREIQYRPNLPSPVPDGNHFMRSPR